MRKLLLVQFNSDMLNQNEDRQVKDYYDKLYSGVRPGYHRFGPTWEIPKWIAEVMYNIKADVLFADCMQRIVNKMRDYDDLAFSALDCNKHFIVDIANQFPGRVFVGGYVNKEYFADCPNVYWCNNVEVMCNWFAIDYKPGVDYQHFAGAKTIARLTMSEGCLHNCKFCTVAKGVAEIPVEQIIQQLYEVACLDSPLVYIDDKTFGQCENHTDLPLLRQTLKERKHAFDGFIIQTTASQLLKLPDHFLIQSGIQYVELGVESYNDDILRAMNKPVNEGTIDLAVDKLRRLGIKVIPNIMIGLPGETVDTYVETLTWLNDNISAISHGNVYTYVDYSKAETADENRGGDSDLDKSFAKAVYDFGMLCLDR